MDLSREHPDPLADSAPPLALDRQRIVRSSAFRRLQHKTQVFLSLESDHDRTRLTHTLEVADLSRTLARAIGLNEELAEVVALAHDLGHPPFGHAGELALRECNAAAQAREVALRAQDPVGESNVRAATAAGFEHNAHSLRVVEVLEHPYPGFRGLNLTRVVRECLAKHTTKYDQPGAHPLQDGRPPPPEGQVAAVADWLTYTLHDLQDGVYAGLVEPAQLAPLELWRRACDDRPPASPSEMRSRLRTIVDRLALACVQDIAAESLRRMRTAAASPGSAAPSAPASTGSAAPNVAASTGSVAPNVAASTGCVAPSAAIERGVSELQSLLTDAVYRHPRVRRSDFKAKRIVRELFEAYVAEPDLLPTRYAERVAVQGAARVATDYLAGMTDRYCLAEHARLFDPLERL